MYYFQKPKEVIVKAYKAILKELRGWNKQRLIRAKMKQEKNREIQKELDDLEADMDQMDDRFSHKEV